MMDDQKLFFWEGKKFLSLSVYVCVEIYKVAPSSDS